MTEPDTTSLRRKLDAVLDKTLFHEGEGPNGSQGEFYVSDRDENGNCIKLLDVLEALFSQETEKLVNRAYLKGRQTEATHTATYMTVNHFSYDVVLAHTKGRLKKIESELQSPQEQTEPKGEQ